MSCLVNITKTFVIACLLVHLLTNCSKKDSQHLPSAPQPPTITSFTVTDYCSRKVTITGTNFNQDITKDSLYFGSLKGTIDSVKGDLLFATYPPITLTAIIRFFCNGFATTSTQPFVSTYPTITSVTPLTAGPGTLVTITGQSFDKNSAADSVFFNNVKAKIISVSATELVVQVPQVLCSGTIRVYCN
jgi:hypothetical protein